ncbi:putative lysophosphatidic acid acyltransferase [Cavenderia fasciculata]|uniref:Lysophosphatidic acid acyltransferase n=1 Tax=Cavenderia fasciculata TaxID=261658 RepID=F4Q685_CACFS|nr:putative lysophosphatidic acid acyltransferase [Cavenderia fasciculata]EGG17459.1 putative lysophosphatidic acid acyltransferase [Cavenderia fasciculata]|eukprot:XP_004355943.1 putative lysophosphatidic acid acyltransferase [Cavenderia fasciculata]
MSNTNKQQTTAAAAAATSPSSPPPQSAAAQKETNKMVDYLSIQSLYLEVSHDPWSLFTPVTSVEVDEIQQTIEDKLLKQLNRQVSRSNKFNLFDVAPFLSDGVEVLVDDEFTKCFTSPEINPWNWNIYLYPAWLFGAFVRYCLLFPLRLTCLVFGAFLFALFFVSVSTFIKNDKQKKHYQRKCLRFLCIVFIMSWSGVIKYHGVRPLRKKNQIFVANHTTVMDVVVLQNQFNYASVGQKHKGLLGFIQDYLLSCIGCLWFDRAEAKDRMAIAKLISKHIEDENKDPLLIFPEGVCVNNNYCVMFKKGAFDLPNAIVYPIAIKYNTLFVDAFWNSKKQSFVRHMFNLMTSWALVCDVWYLEPQTKRPGESSTQFANRVKSMIAKRAGIINVPWDGYLKYFKPSSRFAEAKQKIFASHFIKRFNSGMDDNNSNNGELDDIDSCSTSSSPPPPLDSTNFPTSPNSSSTIKQRKPTTSASNNGADNEEGGDESSTKN